MMRVNNRMWIRWAVVVLMMFMGERVAAQQTIPVQVQPDCIAYLNSGVSATAQVDNRTRGCVVWTLRYTAPGSIGAINVSVQGAPDNGGVPGSWVNITPVITGANPSTTLPQSQVVVNAYFPWVRVILNSSTGTGTIYGSLRGDRAQNVVVQGTAAAGAVVAGVNPILIAGASGGGTIERVNVQGGSVNVFSLITGADAWLNTALGQGLGSNTSLLPVYGNYVFNGATWDRARSASIATFPAATTTTAVNSVGVILIEKGSRWRVISNPAAGTQATASIAAEAAVRHVADCVAFSAVATTAPALTALTVNLRDGATGAGTVIWTAQVAVTATTGQLVQPFNVCGLNLAGTTNTAMTLEFSAGLANLIQSVSLSGFNVN